MPENQPKSLPARPNLEQLRTQAKELQAAIRREDASAIASLRAHHPRSVAPSRASLADAQLVLARAYGFPSWNALREEVELRALDLSARAARFVALAAAADPSPSRCLQRARVLLAREPALVGVDVFTALVTGDVERVRARIIADPAWADTIGGPLPGRRPLHYVAYSRMHHHDPAIGRGLLACATLLLDAGADVDAGFTLEDFASTLRPLYGACGAANHPAMAALLLDRGATIDDGESLYHANEHDDVACLELLVARGASARGTNALARALDFPGTRRITLVLAAGADPNLRLWNGDTPLLHGIRRGRTADELAVLLDAGADPNARVQPHGWARVGRSAVGLARSLGATEIVRALLERGASDESTAFGELVDACASGDLARARQCITAIDTRAGSDDVASFLEIVGRGDAPLITALLSAGFPVTAANGHGQSALHWAAWQGRDAVVRALLDAGAPIEARERQFGGTPLGWAVHGASMAPAGRHLEVVRMLLDAGADVTARNAEGQAMITELDDHAAAQLLREAGAPEDED